MTGASTTFGDEPIIIQFYKEEENSFEKIKNTKNLRAEYAF